MIHINPIKLLDLIHIRIRVEGLLGGGILLCRLHFVASTPLFCDCCFFILCGGCFFIF